jgi:NAD(P)-dependent dehydrogenase (short-subunit alcohol dehydrogenase family)
MSSALTGKVAIVTGPAGGSAARSPRRSRARGRKSSWRRARSSRGGGCPERWARRSRPSRMPEERPSPSRAMSLCRPTSSGVVATAAATFGRLGVLVNNAADTTASAGPADGHPLDGWRHHYETNVLQDNRRSAPGRCRATSGVRGAPRRLGRDHAARQRATRPSADAPSGEPVEIHDANCVQRPALVW